MDPRLTLRRVEIDWRDLHTRSVVVREVMTRSTLRNLSSDLLQTQRRFTRAQMRGPRCSRCVVSDARSQLVVLGTKVNACREPKVGRRFRARFVVLHRGH